MIAHLTGKLIERSTNTAIIDVGGVGYEVNIPLSTYYAIGDVGSDVSLSIHTNVREDAIQLFGFRSSSERELFLKLISVQGVGPKLGITMMSGLSADEIIQAIRSNNIAKLKSIPGVGLKTAERVVIDLRDKVDRLTSAGSMVDEIASDPGGDSSFDDALSALINLGYQRAAADKAIKQAFAEDADLSTEKLLRRALQHLAK